MPHGTLANLATSAFVRTPPALAERIVRCLLSFPQGKAINALDPTAGEGDLLLPCLNNPQARLYGVEISGERAALARERLPHSEIVTCAIEGVSIPKGSMSLVLTNPPYFFQDGKRAEYRILADAGTLLVPGGILVAILPARSAWDGTMINHWCRWYDQIHIWKFPDRTSSKDEGGFEDFTQMCVLGVRRAEPREPEAAEQRRLQGYRYHTPSPSEQGKSAARIRSGWESGSPPSELPTLPIRDPYLVPEATVRPHIVVRHADESQLLAALERCGAHLSPLWQAATVWEEEGMREPPVMPLSGEAHVAAEVLTGLLDGDIVWGPRAGSERGEGTSAQDAVLEPHLLTAFVGHEWVSMKIDEEEQQKLRERGVVSVSARQWQDKPILGVLNLQTGETRYEQGEAVFAFLQPWLHTLAARVIEKRQPLYRLDPAEWELRVVSQIGTDKQLPHAAYPGLSLAQQHRVYAMGRALDLKGRTAIQGEPGVGKTRLAIATAARMAYHWRHRNGPLFQSEAKATGQPTWVRGLRRAWLKNPRTLAILGLTPVLDDATGRVIAYRSTDGTLIPPEEAGPRALPVLISTPKKVTREYGAEIRAAWPQAEVVFIERHTDIPAFFQQCATSDAPAVLGVLSHSLTRAFGREWHPVVREKQIHKREPVMEPGETLLPKLEPAYDKRHVLVGYRWKDSGELYTRETVVSHFFCPGCGSQIRAIPGSLHEVEKRPQDGEEEERSMLGGKGQVEEEEQEDDRYEAVTSRTWFTLKPRWCACRADVRNRPGPRNPLGRVRFRTPLWTDARIEAAQRKQPQRSFAAWHASMSRMQQQARCKAEHASTAELVDLARQDEEALTCVVTAALATRGSVGESLPVSHLVAERATVVKERDLDGQIKRMRLAARSDPRMLEQLVEEAREKLNWEALAFRAQWAALTQSACSGKAGTSKRMRSGSKPSHANGARSKSEPQEQQAGNDSWVCQEPLPDSFSPYMYLYRFYAGCVALSVIDESHNGRGRDTDIAHSHHQAMLAAQTRMLTTGTHYGGDVLGFFHYWYRFSPEFWRRLVLGWNDAEKALERYGVIQEWRKEYESDARRGSGQTNVQVSTIPAPGLSAKLIPYLLEDLVYLTVLDVGAHMPPRIEIPEIVSMRDGELEEQLREAAEEKREAAGRLAACKQQLRNTIGNAATHIDEREAEQDLQRREHELAEAAERERAVQAWVDTRHLAAHYGRLVRGLEDLARKRNTAAQLAKGTIPRWFAALPCDTPFEVWQTTRDRWGDTVGRHMLACTERLEWAYLYPLERRLISLVRQELSEGRRVMLYFEQNDLRSMARRLEWVLRELHPWTLPNSVAAEDRQQAILRAVQQEHVVVIVPYRRVNEGLNLQSGIDTIIWCEMALNLFMLDQASRRAWRLGKREEVRIYYLAYANTAGHTKLRKLGQQSGAAAAFAGEPARGALIEHAGADKSTLARLSSLLEQSNGENVGSEDEENVPVLLTGTAEVAQEEEALKVVFRQRADELRAALIRGREWLGGIADQLEVRLTQLMACPTTAASVWNERPASRSIAIHKKPQTLEGDVERPSAHVHIEQADDTMTALPIVMVPDVPVPATPALPPSATRPMLPMITVPEPASESVELQVLPLVGSRAEVVFGHSEHIALLRPYGRSRRRSVSGESVKRRMPVAVRDIPSLADGTPSDQDGKNSSVQITVSSLWDLLIAVPAPETNGTEYSMRPIPSSFQGAAHPQQTALWD